MRLPRFRIRTMMIAVAVVAVLWVLVRSAASWLLLAPSYQAHADLHAREYATYEQAKLNAVRQAEEARSDPEGYRKKYLLISGDPDDSAAKKDLAEAWMSLARSSEPWIRYHGAMAQKYRRLARYPWLTVEPDPPLPK